MTDSPVLVDVAFWVFGVASVITAWLVFRTDSMVRASFFLLASFVNVGIVLLLLRAEYLSLILILMMAGEMAIMAVFMVMFMMNPAGLNPMNMVHQHRASVAAAAVAFVVLAGVGVGARFPDRPADERQEVTVALGRELLGNSMLVFESAGAALLATMIAAIAVASTRGRFGAADEGSDAPPADPDRPAGDAPPEPEMYEHEGHAGMGAMPDGGGMPGMDHGAHG